MSRMVIMMTRSLAYAIGQDAGNNSMRRGNRMVWNDEDRDVAATKTLTTMLHAADVEEFEKAGIRCLLGDA
jgi:hypothetical protein